MKIFIALALTVSSVAFAETFTCMRASDPDCIRSFSSEISTGVHHVNDLIVGHHSFITGGKHNNENIQINISKADAKTIVVHSDSGLPDMPIGEISDAGDSSLQ